MNTDVVSFYLPDRKALRGRDALDIDPDRDWEVFGTGVYVWILQTFLRLRMAGHAARLLSAPPASGVVVAHADHVDRLVGAASCSSDLVIISVRADRRPQASADFEIVQNLGSAGRRQLFVPSWLQPGMVPRNRARGTHVEKVAYLGTRQQLHDELIGESWPRSLSRRGFAWDDRTVSFASNDELYRELRWNDYSDVDVVVALRPRSTWRATSKPAAKLQNAWAAGVPAILSPELPYSELRRSPLDYLEAETAADALAALERLRADRDLYGAMVRNGLARARDFHVDRITTRWVDALWGKIPARSRRRRRLLHASRRWRATLREH